MISVKKLLGRDDKFFDLLEASADEAKSSSSRLLAFWTQLDQVASTKSLDEFVLSRRKDKKITAEITEELCKTFVTPLEREDIEALSKTLYKIPKTVEKIGERFIICPLNLHQNEAVHRQVTLLEQASGVVAEMVRELRGGTDLERIKDMNDRLQFMEGEADKLSLELLRELFLGTRDAKEVIILKDLYELLEKAIDRCRDAGNVVFQIVLKNS